MLKNTGKFAGKTILITGASRGIGKEIGLKLAKDGANIVIAAKTAEPHPKLPGTIFTAADEMYAAGGRGLPCVVDVRDEKSVDKCVDAAVAEFGGIDILINNASAISVTDTLSTEMKRYDLMHQINLRGSFLMAKKCIPYLKKAENPHILTMSPPLNMDPKWFGSHVAYTISKYGMSMLSLGLSEELKPLGIASNTLWPRTVIWTSAIKMLAGAAVGEKHSRKPQIVADAAYAILGRDAKKVTGKFFIDDEVLASEGIKNLDSYAYDPTAELGPDFFVEMPPNLKALKVNADVAVSTKAIPKPAPDPPKSAGGLSNLVQSFASSIKPEHVAKVGAVIQFAVKTKDGVEEFAFDLKESGKLISGKAAEPCVTLMMDEKLFHSLLNGKTSATTAVALGKLKVQGKIPKALAFQTVLQDLKQK